MNSGINYRGNTSARGRGMAGGGRGMGGPGAMVNAGRNGLLPQVQIPTYNSITGPISQVHQQPGGGVQGFPPTHQINGYMFTPGFPSGAQNPRRLSAPLRGQGRGGMGNIPSVNPPPRTVPNPTPSNCNDPRFRTLVVLETSFQDNLIRDAMREQDLQPPGSTHSNVSSREGSIFNAPSCNSSSLSLPSTTFPGSDRRASTSNSSIASSVYKGKAQEEFLRRQQEEEAVHQRQREEDEQPQRLHSFPTSPTTPGGAVATKTIFPPGHAEYKPETARSGLGITPGGGATTGPDQRLSNPFDRPDTATTVVSLPELGRKRTDPGTLPRRHSSTQSWSGPGHTNSLEMDTAVARHRKPVPKPRANSDTPPTKPLSLSKISTSGADKQPLQYTGPVGPWFPSSPTSSDDDKNSPLPPPTELQGLSATKPNTYCISDDITRRPSVAHRHGFNPEHEVSCISDDMQNGSLCSEKLALPPEFFRALQVSCLSDDLAKVYKGLGEEGEEELLAQMEKEEGSRAMERERVCLGDELAEWHTDRSGLIPVIEEEECETPSHTHTYAAGIPVMVEEADARRISRSKLFNNPGHLARRPPPPPKPPKEPIAPPNIPETPPPPEAAVQPSQARGEMSWEYH